MLLFKALFSWKVRAASPLELATAHVIVSHEFGDQRTLGKTNWELANLAMDLQDRYCLPWIAQYPQNRASIKSRSNVIRAHLLKPDSYLDTEEVNRQVAILCRANGWKKVILCAHPHHAWRAGKNLEYHGLSVVFPDLSSIGYDANCARKELSTPLLFIPWELFARVFYLMKGYLNPPKR